MADPQTIEEWRSVEGWPDYEVSNRGGVRRCTPIIGCCNPKMNQGGPLRPGRDKDGYADIALYRDRKRTQFRVCVLVCTAFNGPKPTQRHQVAHDDGDNTNDVPSNLFWKTCKENMEDRDRHGTTQRGERHFRAAFTNAEMRSIKQRLADGAPVPEMAAEWGVSYQTIWRIKKGLGWRHV